MSSPSFALSVLRDAKENSEKKMTARTPGLEKKESVSPSGLHAVFFRITLYRLDKRGTTRSLQAMG